jgi:predicted Zn-dependent peptidase
LALRTRRSALGECINEVLFSQLREKLGDTYSPKASFKVDSCSGIFEIKISSTKNPEAIERRIIEALATLKDSIDVRELQRFSNRLELKRRKDAQNNDDLLECMVDRTLHGASTHDFKVKTMNSEDICTAAREYP